MNELRLDKSPIVKRFNINKIDADYNIINPIEVYDFINNNKGFIGLINKTKELIKEFFPNSKLYLEFVEDCEDKDLDLIFAYIIDNNDSLENNRVKFNLFFKEFIGFHSIYPSAFDFFNINIYSNEEYFKRKMQSN